MRTRIYTYNPASASARRLARGLGALRIRHGVSRFRPRRGDTIINWGNHTYPTADWNTAGRKPRFINDPANVAIARNKLWTLRKLAEAGVPTVEWTEDPRVAYSWLQPHPHEPDVAAFARTTVTGQGGAGIVPIYNANEYGAEGLAWPDAPLYTKRFRATHECRVHVVFGNTLAQKKRRRSGAERSLVRNHANGYVYCTGNFECPSSVIEQAKAAVSALSLDFGAVDLLYTTNGDARVLEVNTAPGIEGSTLNWYVERFREVI